MSVGAAIDLIAYGLLLTGLSLVAGRYTAEGSGLLFIIGISGSLIVWLWAVLALRGLRCCRYAIWTLVIISVALIGFSANEWRSASKGVSDSRVAALATTLLLVFSVGQLIILLRDRNERSGK